jgi:hypothetical protein
LIYNFSNFVVGTPFFSTQQEHEVGQFSTQELLLWIFLILHISTWKYEENISQDLNLGLHFQSSKYYY